MPATDVEELFQHPGSYYIRDRSASPDEAVPQPYWRRSPSHCILLPTHQQINPSSSRSVRKRSHFECSIT